MLSLFLASKQDEVNPPRNGRLVASKNKWNFNLGIILQDKAPPPLEVGSLVKILVNVDIKRILTISEVGQWSMNVVLAKSLLISIHLSASIY